MRTQTNSFRVLPIVTAFMLNLVVGPFAPTAQLATSALRATQGSAAGGMVDVAMLAGPSPIHAGDEASFTLLVWNAGPEDALLTAIHDELPDGVEWGKPIVVNPDGDDSCSMASSIGPDGVAHRSFDCEFGSLAASAMPEAPFDVQSPGKVITITGQTDGEDCGALHNQAWAEASDTDPVGPATATVVVKCSSLVIDVSADTEEVHFAFDADGNVLSVDPAHVTWTLLYTLTDGPVTNAVITDALPEHLNLVSASDGGAHDAASGVLSWKLGTLAENGVVSFVTTVDPEAPETEPIVNVASIASDQTPEEAGQDEIRVTSGAELGGNPAPPPTVPDTALAAGRSGTPLSIPLGLLLVLVGGSLGVRTLTTARAVRRRR